MSITATMRGQELTVRVDLPEHVQLPAITKAIQDAIENHPRSPKPGEVTRDAYLHAVQMTDNDRWAAAESAAREGYVSKAEIRKALESCDSLIHPETCDLVDAIGEIRELVK